ncbi:TPA: DUF488 family protein [Legionella pneumophila]|nr:DUF488 family protein [Legionella pneumophila]
MTAPEITLSRVYSPPEHKEGLWILVDRLWPRGIKKESFPLDMWLKDVAPSPALRKWFHQDSDHWHEFAKQYAQELKEKPELIEHVLALASTSPVTLFYAAKDLQHNHALVLQKVLKSWPKIPEIK